jgi:hypothetical protein
MVDGDVFLLHADEVDGEIILTQSLLYGSQIELIIQGASVRFQGSTESINVLCFSSVDSRLPGLLSAELGNACPVGDPTVLALEGLVTFLFAEPTCLFRAVASRVAFLAAEIAGTIEDTLVGLDVLAYVECQLSVKRLYGCIMLKLN